MNKSDEIFHRFHLTPNPTCFAIASAMPTGKSFLGCGAMNVLRPFAKLVMRSLGRNQLKAFALQPRNDPLAVALACITVDVRADKLFLGYYDNMGAHYDAHFLLGPISNGSAVRTHSQIVYSESAFRSRSRLGSDVMLYPAST
jgi:hypothetical protein